MKNGFEMVIWKTMYKIQNFNAVLTLSTAKLSVTETDYLLVNQLIVQ